MLPSQPTRPVPELLLHRRPVRQVQLQVIRRHRWYRHAKLIQHQSKSRPQLDPLLALAITPTAMPPIAPQDTHRRPIPRVPAKIAFPTAPRPFPTSTAPTPQPAVGASIKHQPRSPLQQEASNLPPPPLAATTAAPVP